MYALPQTTTTNLLLAPSLTGVQELDNSSTEEVLAFLKARPLNTAYLTGLIQDNGVVSSYNRGTFYSYRNFAGELEGIALIGHAILMEATSADAVRSFAETAQSCADAHVIVCEESHLEKFWGYYAEAGKEMRRACRELLFELRWPSEVEEPARKLRPATLGDLELLAPVHAEMAFEESGVSPLESDREGFMKRYARRIQQGRTWILTDNGKLIFKADVVAETAESTYIEGVWVNPDARRQGFGRSCMAQLAKMLLWRTKSLCLFVNDENEEAQAFYKDAGYHIRTVYDTIFLQ